LIHFFTFLSATPGRRILERDVAEEDGRRRDWIGVGVRGEDPSSWHCWENFLFFSRTASFDLCHCCFELPLGHCCIVGLFVPYELRYCFLKLTFLYHIDEPQRLVLLLCRTNFHRKAIEKIHPIILCFCSSLCDTVFQNRGIKIYDLSDDAFGNKQAQNSYFYRFLTLHRKKY
jgi:hypothetical protein